jgi:hypothetical protein
MSALDLFLSRKALAAGVGLTTRRNRVLPPTISTPIPARIGRGKPLKDLVAEIEVEDRTFVFSKYGETVGKIGIRIGTTISVIVSSFVLFAASYFVATAKALLSPNKYKDVWRLDRLTSPASRMKINGASQSVQTTFSATTDYDRYPLPYIRLVSDDYANSNPNDATLSLLYLGRSVHYLQKVCVIKKDGTEGAVKVPTGVASGKMYPIWSAGLRLTEDGQYKYYGANIVFGSYSTQIIQVPTSWSVINTLLTSPFVQETSSGNNTLFGPGRQTFNFSTPVYTTYITTTSADYEGNYPDLGNTPGTYSPAGFQTITQVSALSYSIDTSNYAYSGSDIAMRFRCSMAINGTRKLGNAAGSPQCLFTYTSHDWNGSSTPPFVVDHIVNSSVFAVGQGSYDSMDRTTVMEYMLDSVHPKIKRLLHGTFNFAHASGKYGPTTGRQINQTADPLHDGVFNYSVTDVAISQGGPAPVPWKWVFEVSTVDYIYSDLDEDVHLTLETTLHCERTESFSGPLTATFTVNYVVSVRGTQYLFPKTIDLNILLTAVETSPVGQLPTPEVYEAFGYSVGDGFFLYVSGFYPVAVFDPAFMNQGNCPWIAYTTLAEEAAGATPQFYLDVTLTPLLYSQISATETHEQYRYGSSGVSFAPHQLLQIYWHYFAHILNDGSAFTQNENAWQEKLFRADSPTRVALCNGVKGPWSSKLGVGFETDPQITITRI